MSLEEAIEIIEHYNSWRLGDFEEINYTPKEITKALYRLIIHAKGTQ